MGLSLIIHYHKSYIGIFKHIGITESENRLVILSRNILEAPQAKLQKSLRKLRGCLVCGRGIHLMFPLRTQFWEGGCRDAYGQH